jgi:sulfhydrogenase subunit beta (sulfur reductase)
VSELAIRERAFVDREQLQSLLDVLMAKGYQTVGPVARDGAIVYAEVHSIAELPAGWTDEQSPGAYRLKKRSDDALFGYTVGPQSWKRFLHPPALCLWQARREGTQVQFTPVENQPDKLAFFGVRACELHAMAIQDRVFMQGAFADRDYAARRANIFIVAVQCAQAAATCFCVSMHSGPKAASGFDLALTEMLENGRHYFVVEIGTELGAQVLNAIPHRAASAAETDGAERVVANTARQMGRTLDTEGIKELLYRSADHPRWDAVAQRCLTCANCTLVCPTCFCTTVEDTTDLTAEHAERRRKWDSCFTTSYSYIHGGSVRATTQARYRQWLTHKLAAWIDQFGTSGCVGCGRCITWCPAAIDITEEARALRMTANKENRDAAN